MKRLLTLLVFLSASAVHAAGSCVPDGNTLCLDDSRFAVQAPFKVGPGLGPTVLATGVPLTDQTGYFWFFDSSNVELVVKVLDGCEVNGYFWVFAGGLTNVEVGLTVTDTDTDTETGSVRQYNSPYGTPFSPIQDTDAFECP